MSLGVRHVLLGTVLAAVGLALLGTILWEVARGEISRLGSRLDSIETQLSELEANQSANARQGELAPSTESGSSSCPAGFSACAGKCLVRIDQAVTYPEAETLCAELGAHLVVPRSEAGHQCLETFAGDKLLWLGITETARNGVFFGADGLGVVPSEGHWWAVRNDGVQEPADVRAGENYVVYVPPQHYYAQGWHDNNPRKRWYPLCQLPPCNRRGCE